MAQLLTVITVSDPLADDGALFPTLESERHACRRTILDAMSKKLFWKSTLTSVNLTVSYISSLKCRPNLEAKTKYET